MATAKAAQCVLGSLVTLVLAAWFGSWSISALLNHAWVQFMFTGLLSFVLLVMGLALVDMSTKHPSNSHTWLTVCIQYLTVGPFAYLGQWKIRQLESSGKNCGKAQEASLLKLLDRNKDTVYGKDHKFSEIKSREDYVRMHPLTKYQDLEGYVKRIVEDGEENVLYKEKTVYIGKSSGTSGKNKLLPINEKMGDTNMMLLWMKSYANRGNHGLRRILALRYGPSPKHTKTRIPIGGVANFVSPHLPHHIGPKELGGIPSEMDAWYAHAVFGLSEEHLGLVDGILSTQVMSFFQVIENNWELLCDDISRGQINPGLGIDDEIRNVLNQHLQPNPDRAEFLRKEFQKGFKYIAPRIWPHLSAFYMVTTGALEAVTKQVRDCYIGQEIRAYCSTHGATEGVTGLGVTDDPNDLRYSFLPSPTFQEFIEGSQVDEENPKTYFIDQLEVGKSYEVVLTTCCGLYRYRLGDVVKIVGHEFNWPAYEFQYRTGQILNLFWEKTPESVFFRALNKTLQAWPELGLVDYTAVENNIFDKLTGKEQSSRHYVLFLEVSNVDGQPILTNEQKDMFDDSLCAEFELYRDLRKQGSINRMHVIQIRNNGFLRLKSIMNKDSRNQQFKMPRALRNEEHLKVLLSEELREDDTDIIHPAKLDNLTAVPNVQDSEEKEKVDDEIEVEEINQEKEEEEEKSSSIREEEEAEERESYTDIKLSQESPLFTKPEEIKEELDVLIDDRKKSEGDKKMENVHLQTEEKQNQDILFGESKEQETETYAAQPGPKDTHVSEEEPMQEKEKVEDEFEIKERTQEKEEEKKEEKSSGIREGEEAEQGETYTDIKLSQESPLFTKPEEIKEELDVLIDDRKESESDKKMENVHLQTEEKQNQDILFVESKEQETETYALQPGPKDAHESEEEPMQEKEKVEDEFEIEERTQEKEEEEKEEKSSGIREEEEAEEKETYPEIKLSQESPLFTKPEEMEKELDVLIYDRKQSESDRKMLNVDLQTEEKQNQDILFVESKEQETETYASQPGPKIAHDTEEEPMQEKEKVDDEIEIEENNQEEEEEEIEEKSSGIREEEEAEPMQVLRQGNLGEKRKEKKKEIVEYQKDWLGDVDYEEEPGKELEEIIEDLMESGEDTLTCVASEMKEKEKHVLFDDMKPADIDNEDLNGEEESPSISEHKDEKDHILDQTGNIEASQLASISQDSPLVTADSKSANGENIGQIPENIITDEENSKISNAEPISAVSGEDEPEHDRHFGLSKETEFTSEEVEEILNVIETPNKKEEMEDEIEADILSGEKQTLIISGDDKAEDILPKLGEEVGETEEELISIEGTKSLAMAPPDGSEPYMPEISSKDDVAPRNDIEKNIPGETHEAIETDDDINGNAVIIKEEKLESDGNATKETDEKVKEEIVGKLDTEGEEITFKGDFTDVLTGVEDITTKSDVKKTVYETEDTAEKDKQISITFVPDETNKNVLVSEQEVKEEECTLKDEITSELSPSDVSSMKLSVKESNIPESDIPVTGSDVEHTNTESVDDPMKDGSSPNSEVIKEEEGVTTVIVSSETEVVLADLSSNENEMDENNDIPVAPSGETGDTQLDEDEFIQKAVTVGSEDISAGLKDEENRVTFPAGYSPVIDHTEEFLVIEKQVTLQRT